MMSDWIKKPHVIIGIGIGVGVVTFAVHVLRRQNNTEILRTDNNKVNRSIRIPKGFVGHVLGRGGATIKEIREKSKSRITFDDAGNEYTVATLVGLPENVEEAATLINNIISNRHACVTREIILNEGISNSVWKNINYVRQVCDLTRAKVSFDFLPSKGRQDHPVKVIIKGKKEEVEAALEMIDEFIAEAEVNSSKQTHMAGRALPENLPLPPSHTLNKGNLYERLTPSSSDGYIETYISSVISPSKFWVQIFGYKSTQLDKLATEMTEFYNDEKNKARFQLVNVNRGDIVAAFYEGDRSWYRAEVVEVFQENDGKAITVFYVDFGDCATLAQTLVCVMNQDFLSIPFQAIGCCLADVEPLGEVWTKEAIEEFEKMTYLAQWKIVMAKVNEKPTSGNDAQNLNSVQLVTLMDTTTNKDLNISEELVLKGHARFTSTE